MAKKFWAYQDILLDVTDFLAFNTPHYIKPFCASHKMELALNDDENSGYCYECDKWYPLGKELWMIKDHLEKREAARDYQNAEIFDIDGVFTPVVKTSKKTLTSDNGDYWIEARLNDSKRGKQIAIYVGKKGEKNKVQLLANVDQKKLNFDQNNQDPREVFSEITATFLDGSVSEIRKKK